MRNRHCHAIEQASRRWRGGRRDDSARKRRKILISTQFSTRCKAPRASLTPASRPIACLARFTTLLASAGVHDARRTIDDRRRVGAWNAAAHATRRSPRIACAKIASRRRSRWVRVRTLDRRGPVGQMPRFGYMVYVNGCSSDRHLIYVDRHAGARAVVAGRGFSAGLDAATCSSQDCGKFRTAHQQSITSMRACAPSSVPAAPPSSSLAD